MATEGERHRGAQALGFASALRRTTSRLVAATALVVTLSNSQTNRANEMRTSARPRAGTRGSRLFVRSLRFAAMVRRGSTVRVRQRASQKPCKWAFLLSVQPPCRRLAGTRRVHFRTSGNSRARAAVCDQLRGLVKQPPAPGSACKSASPLLMLSPLNATSFAAASLRRRVIPIAAPAQAHPTASLFFIARASGCERRMHPTQLFDPALRRAPGDRLQWGARLRFSTSRGRRPPAVRPPCCARRSCRARRAPARRAPR